ncbi:MAG TPA: hypothetical protein DEW39_03490 [Brevibacterium sp.]|nr:hypothetical protein [Brevibacterium sp.]
MFPPGAPEVAIGSLQIGRSMVAPSGAVTVPGEEEPEDGLDWTISGIATDQEQPPMALLGDLFARRDGVVVGVSVSASIALKDAAGVLTEDEVSDRTQYLAPWATHALYDVAASEARRLLLSVGADSSMIPLITPIPPNETASAENLG